MPPSHPFRPRWAAPLTAASLLTAIAFFRSLPAAEPARGSPAEYVERVRPLVAAYCKECHSGTQPEADVDLEKFAALADVRKATRVWQKVGEMLDSGQMPPKGAKQPTDGERAALKAWVRGHLKAEAAAHAGDPGRVTLRRLSNAEYTYTIRDLTGVASLDPAREFPVDGAAGEGFTNTGDALVMSPALLAKYLDAAKGVAAHAVLLPDGIRFSPSTTRRDWTNEILADIRKLYLKYSDPSGGSKVALHGLVWDGKEGGRLPVEKYVAATLAERDAIRTGRKALAEVAAERGLSGKYLEALWRAFTDGAPMPLFDGLRERWRAARPDEAAAVAAEIARWQNAVWKFNIVGNIGLPNGPKSWLEPVDSLTVSQSVRWAVPADADGGATLYLVASDCGDGNGDDFVVWQRPRFTAPGRPDLLLKDVRAVSRERAARRTRALAATAAYLRAADGAANSPGPVDVPALAEARGLDAEVLGSWLDLLGVGTSGPVKLTGHYTTKLSDIGKHEFVRGWGSTDTPLIAANSSDRSVRIPGDLNGHGLAVHPSPVHATAVAWQSPIPGRVRVEASVQHANPACGNGVTWAVEVRRGTTRRTLASGIAHGSKPAKIDAIDDLPVAVGDAVSLVVGPRDGEYSCDLTAIDLTVSSNEETWNLAADAAGDIHAGNPHADGFGNPGVWHFYTEPASPERGKAFGIPPGSLLGKWINAPAGNDRERIAAEVQTWLASPPPTDKTSPDAALHRQLSALGGPLFGRAVKREPFAAGKETWGVDPTLFGRHPNGTGAVDADSLCVKAPAVVEIKVPADLIVGYEFAADAIIHPDSRDGGTAQLQATGQKPEFERSLRPDQPILVAESGAARARLTAALAAFRDLFPTAVCYSKIVPVDEVITFALHYREDHRLARLMLGEEESRHLDRLWDELRYVNRDALVQVDVFKQYMEYATQGAEANAKPFEALREPLLAAAASFRQRLVDTEPRHLDGVLEFAGRAYRRPLTDAERDELTGLYRRLRSQEIPHDDAIRLTLARVLVAPPFLYKLEKPGAGATATPLGDWELANRLSYFLWSSAPDAELRAAAAAGRLRDPDELAAQTRRMIQDDRVRRLAVEFGCQWLNVRGFDAMNEKSERHFPAFAGLRADMYEETILFFTDLFRADRRISDILDPDAAFLNERLADLYGIPGVTGGHWRRVEGVRKYGRGGILALATTLAIQSGASRTSPILRGNWVSEVLLGEKLPRPPKGVPQLPDDEAATDGLTVRQLVERHTSDPNCAACHKRIDAYGFALEAFDPIGRRREKDLGGHPVDTKTTAADGTVMNGIDGLREYLLTKRKDAFGRQFCKKLLGYALGRAAQLSDEPLLDDMQAALAKGDGRISVVLEAIVRSRQFREIRGREYTDE